LLLKSYQNDSISAGPKPFSEERIDIDFYLSQITRKESWDEKVSQLKTLFTQRLGHYDA